MNTADQVERLRTQMLAAGKPKPEIIREVALACVGWPYVFGAWGELCLPANRRRRVRDAHPTIKSKCQVLRDKNRKPDCIGCQWFPDGNDVRMYDCRGFTRWLLQQVGLDLANSKGQPYQGATSQYKATNCWARKGSISEMPDCVCCVFRYKASSGKFEHTGMHIGGGVVVDCSVNVRSVGMSGWTHYAIPVGLYGEGEIPVETIKTTVRRGNRGQAVREMQDILNSLGYACGEADGVFGTKTFNALVSFQTDKNLDPDGVCGPKTWAALLDAERKTSSGADAERTSSGADAPPSPEGEGLKVSYRVICEGMSWAHVKEILKICPMADVSKE